MADENNTEETVGDPGDGVLNRDLVRQQTSFSYPKGIADAGSTNFANSIQFNIFVPVVNEKKGRIGSGVYDYNFASNQDTRRYQSFSNSILNHQLGINDNAKEDIKKAISEFGLDDIGQGISDTKGLVVPGVAYSVGKLGLEVLSAIFSGDKTVYRRIDKIVAMYMPPGLNFGTQIDWSVDDLGTLAGVIGKSKSFKEAAKIGTNAFLARAVTGFIPGLSGANQKAAGFTFNPYREVLFRSVGNRQFQFTFKMMPRDVVESNHIKEIINIFRFHAHPEIRKDKSFGDGALLTYPSEFEIRFFNGREENTFIPKISTCALTNINVVYNTSGLGHTHPDGSPISTELTLTFTELEILTKDRVAAGF